jgi:integrase
MGGPTLVNHRAWNNGDGYNLLLAATILLSLRVPPNVVKEILGHSDISITLGIYGHVLPGMHEEAMDKWNDLFHEQR